MMRPESVRPRTPLSGLESAVIEFRIAMLCGQEAGQRLITHFGA